MMAAFSYSKCSDYSLSHIHVLSIKKSLLIEILGDVSTRSPRTYLHWRTNSSCPRQIERVPRGSWTLDRVFYNWEFVSSSEELWGLGPVNKRAVGEWRLRPSLLGLETASPAGVDSFQLNSYVPECLLVFIMCLSNISTKWQRVISGAARYVYVNVCGTIDPTDVACFSVKICKNLNFIP